MGDVNEKKEITIAGYNLYYLMGCFTFYSIAGFLVETIFGLITEGVIESRKSFLYGPFCAIYGIGAILLLIELRYFKKNFVSLFLGGAILGSVVEYFVSLFGELIFNVKWWDYSSMPFNINGRVCIYFSIFWGFLSVCFLQLIHPKLDNYFRKVGNRIPKIILKNILVILILIQFFDWIISTIAVQLFTIRKIHDYDLNIDNKQNIELNYEKLYNNEFIVNLTQTIFDDKTMIQAFPNLKIQDKEGKIIFFRDLVVDIEPYYLKIDKAKILRYVPKLKDNNMDTKNENINENEDKDKGKGKKEEGMGN